MMPAEYRETEIELLRHGEPVGGRRYRGQLDDVLSEKGWQQMWNAVGDRADWQQIVSSPLQRCCAFAMALGERHGLPVKIDARFAEVGFGSWEGRTRQELEADDPGQVARFLRDPVGNRPPGAELLDDFTARVQAGLDDVVQAYAGQRVLLVDDLLATGGSAQAAAGLIERLGGQVVGIAFMIDLTFLKGIEKLEKYDVFSLIQF